MLLLTPLLQPHAQALHSRLLVLSGPERLLGCGELGLCLVGGVLGPCLGLPGWRP